MSRWLIHFLAHVCATEPFIIPIMSSNPQGIPTIAITVSHNSTIRHELVASLDLNSNDLLIPGSLMLNRSIECCVLDSPGRGYCFEVFPEQIVESDTVVVGLGYYSGFRRGIDSRSFSILPHSDYGGNALFIDVLPVEELCAESSTLMNISTSTDGSFGMIVTVVPEGWPMNWVTQSQTYTTRILLNQIHDNIPGSSFDELLAGLRGVGLEVYFDDGPFPRVDSPCDRISLPALKYTLLDWNSPRRAVEFVLYPEDYASGLVTGGCVLYLQPCESYSCSIRWNSLRQLVFHSYPNGHAVCDPLT